MKRAIIALLTILMLSLPAVPASAAETEQTAESIFDYKILDDYFAFQKADPLYDGNTVFPIPFGANASVSLSRELPQKYSVVEAVNPPWQNLFSNNASITPK